MKNIYYLSCSPIPSQKANSIQVMKMCQAFALHCKEVVLFCIQRKGEKDLHKYYGVKKSFKIIPVKLPGIKFLNRIIYALIVFGRLKKKNAAGILYSRDIFSTGVICLLNPQNFSIVFEAHAPPSTKLRKRVLKFIFKSKYFKGVVSISEALKQEYLRIYGNLIIDKIVVAHDGADSSQIPKVMLDQQSYAQKGERLKLGYIGSLFPGKGSEIIMQLAKKLPAYEFHVVGGSKEQIEELQEMHPCENITFYGFVSPEKIYDYMDKFDVMLAPYKSKVIVGSGTLDISKWMSPLKLFEYMGGGKPIVASDLPVLKEVIKDDKIALLADPDNLEEWEYRIKHLESEEKRSELGKNAQKVFFENYTWEKRTIYILKKLFDEKIEISGKLNDKLFA